MEYMTLSDAAIKRGITSRRIRVLCSEEGIPGAYKLGHIWVVPKDAAKPTDIRIKSGKYVGEHQKRAKKT